MTYSDRFIPSRAASSRLNFSVFDRETATSEIQKPPDKDVRSLPDCSCCDTRGLMLKTVHASLASRHAVDGAAFKRRMDTEC